MIEVRFTRFQLENKENGECNDYVQFKYKDIVSENWMFLKPWPVLYLYKRIQTLPMCGTRRHNSWSGEWVPLDTNQFEMVFYADDSVTDKGFRLQWRPFVTAPVSALSLLDFSINLKSAGQKTQCSVNMLRQRFDSALSYHRNAIRSRAEKIKSQRLDNNLNRTYRMMARSRLFKYPKHKRTTCQATSPQESGWKLRLRYKLIKLTVEKVWFNSWNYWSTSQDTMSFASPGQWDWLL